MRYLVDTDWMIDFLRAKADAVRLFSALAAEGLATSLIVYGEVYDGIYHGANSQAREATFLNALQSIPDLTLDEEIMRRFARIRGDLRQSGQIIGDTDLLIAATAIQHSLTLVTRNLQHYQRIPGLAIYQERATT